MRLQHIQFKNINQFKNLSIDLSNSTSTMTVILGEQDSGKTSILKNIFHTLSWFSARYKDLRTAGIVIADSDMYDDSLYASIQIEVSYPKELGSLLEDAGAQPDVDGLCLWQLIKTRNSPLGIGLSRPETTQLEKLVTRYQKQLIQDPLFSIPCIAYYPVERFVHEANIQNKNAATNLGSLHHAYDLTSLSFTMFSKFFDWYREVYDLENAQTAQLLKQYLDPEQRFQGYDQMNELFSGLEQAYRLSPQRCLNSLRSTLHSVLPEMGELFIEFQPRLRLMITFNGQKIPFMQLSQSYRIWVALVGDLVRRACLLNPQSLYPCMEAEGIVMIDEVDAFLDQAHRHNILTRLQRAFPRMQFIVSALNSDIVEQNNEVACFQLLDQQLFKLDFAEHQQKLQSIYQGLEIDTQIESLPQEATHSETSPALSSLEDIISLAEQLNENERAQLLEHVKKITP
ncbi:MAG: AAA family ATPase [Acinetobacter populi]|jgi:predicted ATP-binding protein involved in virulence|uniref:AAA family ATPase n=1 Tax=Acinetobacter populi TaxID=1582270 RepID=UPI0023565A5C|nr:AAA family ATPase [Acinetobacter populi]MCH4246691.1 AAA family ATPase [Acinetobacter populi]